MKLSNQPVSRPLLGALLAAVLAASPFTAVAAAGPLEQALAAETGHDAVAVREFYATQGYRPIWDADKAEQLLARLRNAPQEGLSASRYPTSRIEKLNDARDGIGAAERELLLSGAFIQYARDVGSGRVDPAKADPDWHIRHSVPDAAGLLTRASKTHDFKRLLEELPPQSEAYARLREALALYREIAKNGGWPTQVGAVSKELPRLEPGVIDPRIPAVRERLRASGELTAADPENPELYDDALKEAVARFQERHGLEADGVIGPQTRVALNTSVEARIRQLVVSMERLRWVPRHGSERSIRVNVPAFELEVTEQGRLVMGMKVIAGRPKRPTPSFTASMSHLIFNPYWNIPSRILKEDVIPAVQKDKEYLTKKNIRILSGSGEETQEIDPEAIDWDDVRRNGFPYRLRRDPGEQNDLGRVKFLLPNSFDIYLHDTPSRRLFAKSQRAFSSGCIRLEHPVDLAELALGWERDRIEKAIEAGKTREVRLPQAIPVHIVYQTAWVDKEGLVQFREDIYRRDAEVWRALTQL